MALGALERPLEEDLLPGHLLLADEEELRVADRVLRGLGGADGLPGLAEEDGVVLPGFRADAATISHAVCKRRDRTEKQASGDRTAERFSRFREEANA